MMEDLKAHALPPDELLRKLSTGYGGLSEEEARRRLSVYGRNEIREKKESLLVLFLNQFRNPLVGRRWISSS